MTQVLASLRVNPDHPKALQMYLASAMPLIEAAGGRVAKQIELGEQIIGEEGSTMALLVNYPNREAVDAVFSSPEYQKLIPVRELAFLSYNVAIVENEELPEFA